MDKRMYGIRSFAYRIAHPHAVAASRLRLPSIWNPSFTRRSGDSLVFIFPLAPMLTFTSAVGKLNVRVLWHHRMLLQVISQSYCQVFVKSYNFVFEKIDKEGSPREK